MQTTIIKKLVLIYCSPAIIMCLFACKKFVDAGAPQTEANAENVYTSDATAIAVLTGIYSNFAAGVPGPNFSSGLEGISLRAGLSADEFTLFAGANEVLSRFYANSLVANQNTNVGTDYWNGFYDYIYHANSAIEGLTNSTGLTPSVKDQLTGEAKFVRAFIYFYLINLYGDVPLVKSTDYSGNRSLSRSSREEVYELIKSDLNDALSLLSGDYLNGILQTYSGSLERVRPTKWAAAALLARTYLYTGDFVNAEQQATAVINNTALFDTVSLNDVFLKNNKEAIWQLQPVKTSQNTDDSRVFIVAGDFSDDNPVRISDTLLGSFEADDKRKSDGIWVSSITLSGTTYYYPYKYKNNGSDVTEYMMVLRLAEQYLIRAEARAQQNKISEAKDDLNIIRSRAGLLSVNTSDKDDLLKIILHERQTELFSEWGHRWFDLKRTNNINSLMINIAPIKGGVWEDNDQLYPIPFLEIQRDNNLHQNPGY